VQNRIIFCIGVALLPIAGASALDASDMHLAAGPGSGSYWQGSLAAPGYDPYGARSDGYGEQPPSYGATPGAGGFDSESEWYSSDWYERQPGGYGWQDDYGRDWSAPADRRYGRDVGEPRDRRYREAPAAPPRYAEPRQDDPYAYRREADRDAYRRDDLDRYSEPPRQPAQAPYYRFREDPRLQGPKYGSQTGGYRFRPLTDRERERQRTDDTAGAFPPVRRERDRGSDRDREREADGVEAFGYEPDWAPGSFYQRYYRTDP